MAVLNRPIGTTEPRSSVAGLWGNDAEISYVVSDLDAALQFWTGTMGVGPFFVSD